MTGALPLGLATGTSYEAMRFELPLGSKLTLVSDGVVEAQNQRGELFGFDRTGKLSMQSANAIAEAARQFGQRDDITVVIIERESAPLESSPSLSALEALPG